MYSKDPIQKASLFGHIFEAAPTYEELISGTPKMADIINLNEAYLESQYKLAGEHGVPDYYVSGYISHVPSGLEVQILTMVRNIIHYFDKKKTHVSVFSYLAGELDYRWNQIWESLYLTYEKLIKLGFVYNKEKIVFTKSS